MIELQDLREAQENLDATIDRFEARITELQKEILDKAVGRVLAKLNAWTPDSNGGIEIKRALIDGLPAIIRGEATE